jgi:WD40 repeat protein
MIRPTTRILAAKGGSPVRDDDDSGLAEHLVNVARRHEAPPPPQQAPAEKAGIARVGHFHGNVPGEMWLCAAWSPDGSQLVYGGKTQVGRGVLHAWDGESGHHETFGLRHLTHGVSGPVISLAWSPDSRRLATVEAGHRSGPPAVHVRSQAERSRAIGVPPGLPVSQVAWSADGTLLALSGADCQDTVLVDPSDGGQRHVLPGVSGPVAWEPEGRLLAGVEGTSVVLFDPVSGKQSAKLTAHEHKPTALAWARHGRYLAIADGEKIFVWDAQAADWKWKLPWTTAEGDRGPDSTVAALDWLDGGGYLLEFRPRGGAWRDEQGSTVSTVILWDIETGQWQFVELYYETLRTERRRPIPAVALAPDGRRLALAYDTAPPVIWRITGDLPHYAP